MQASDIRRLTAVIAAVSAGQAAFGASLTQRIVERDTAATNYTAVPGEIVIYEIRGELDSPFNNDGLALWNASLNFMFSAFLENNLIVVRPLDGSMASFVFTGPDGYGGTSAGIALNQIGGGQDSLGDVALHVAEPPFDGGSGEQVLALGAYQVPYASPVGETHMLTLSEGSASVLSQGWTPEEGFVQSIPVDQFEGLLTIAVTEGDCNENGIPDAQDIAFGDSADCDGDARPDDCELDCNGNGVVDDCDIMIDPALDSDADGFIDACVAVLAGDCDANNLVDAADYQNLLACMNGPAGGLVGPACACFDIDGSDSVDMADFAVVQRNFGKKQTILCYTKAGCETGSYIGSTETKADCTAAVIGGKSCREGLFGDCISPCK